MKRLLVGLTAASALIAQTGAIQYAKDGTLTLPKDYREWVFLSSGIGMAYTDGSPNESPAFENVFVNRDAYRGFLKTGTWPDKTVMLLEIRGSDSKVSINKNGRVQSGVRAIEAHVKDSSRGGWNFYAFREGAQQGTVFPKTAECFTCHEASGAVDSTFVQFYPTLIDVAKQHGTFKQGAE